MRALRVVALTTGLLVLAGCTTPPGGITASGTVDDALTAVTVPALGIPAVNLDAGFTDTTGTDNPLSGRSSAQVSAVGTTYSIGTTVRIASVAVEEGDSVQAGDVLVTIDPTALAAQLAAAKADRAVATAGVDLIGEAIETTFDRQADVADAREEILDALTELTSTKATLLKTRKTLRKELPMARAALKQINQAIAELPAGVPVPDELRTQKEKLTTAIRKLKAGVKKVNAALPRLNRAREKARSGLRRLDDAAARILDARGTLAGLQDVAGIQADALQVPVDLARVNLDLTVLVAPVNGVVVSAARPGDLLAPGATVVSIREAVPSTITAWLSPAQLDQACPGDTAIIAADWATSTLEATLTRIDPRLQYPPSSVATDEVHLTRAAEVQFTTTTEQLPAGVPVEVTISGCRPVANFDETNG